MKLRKVVILFWVAIIILSFTACTRQAEPKPQVESSTQDEIKLNDSEKEILSKQAELLTQQIVSGYDSQNSGDSVLMANDSVIRHFWLSICIYDQYPNYPYLDTYELSSDGVCRFPEETIDTITEEVFQQEDFSLDDMMKYDDEEQVYYYTSGFGCSVYGFEKMTAVFQNNDSALLLSYELWSDPNFPNFHKIDDYQSLFAVKPREDGSYYLQYLKTEKPAGAES